MQATIGLALFAVIIFAVYCAAAFLVTRNVKYGRWMVYSVLAAFVTIGAIVLVG